MVRVYNRSQKLNEDRFEPEADRYENNNNIFIMGSSSYKKEKQMRAMAVGTNLSRIMLFLAFAAGIYSVDTDTASAQGFQRQEVQECATEGGICRLPYPTEIIYGNGRRVNSRGFNNQQVPCTNEVFGDPAPGSVKSCSYVVRDDGRDRGGYGRDRGWDQGRGGDYGRGRDDYGRGRDGRDRDYGRGNGRGEQWQRCAKEGQYCDFSGRKRVRYGTQDRYVERVMRGGTPCDNRTFGDPARKTAKSCYVLN